MLNSIPSMTSSEMPWPSSDIPIGPQSEMPVGPSAGHLFASSIKQLPDYYNKNSSVVVKNGVSTKEFWEALLQVILDIGGIITKKKISLILHFSASRDGVVNGKVRVYKTSSASSTRLVAEFRRLDGCTVAFNNFCDYAAQGLSEVIEPSVRQRHSERQSTQSMPCTGEPSPISHELLDLCATRLESDKNDVVRDVLQSMADVVRNSSIEPGDKAAIRDLIGPHLKSDDSAIQGFAVNILALTLQQESIDFLLELMGKYNSDSEKVEVARSTSRAILAYSTQFVVIDRTDIEALANARPYADEVTRNLRASLQ